MVVVEVQESAGALVGDGVGHCAHVGHAGRAGGSDQRGQQLALARVYAGWGFSQAFYWDEVWRDRAVHELLTAEV